MLPRVAPTRRWVRFLFPALITLVVAYGALVRLDRLFRAYGPFDHPDWLVRVQGTVGALRDPLVPSGWNWKKVERPYVGGDPIGYLRFAREMRHFYQGHFREPVFLATTRMYLAATDDQDVAISLASLTFSVACVFATYLLGSTLGSRWAGLFAAMALAVEYEIVTWAPDGWRDEAFSTFVLLSAAAFLRLQRRWTWPSAVLVGVAGAAACLTRLSSLTFLVPAVFWLAWPRASVPWRTQIARLGLAVGVMTVLVSPYLINCFRETGDPFIAVNQHTGFYQPSTGIAMDTQPSALAFTMAPFARKPIATTDTALRGLFVTPFATKWRGFTDVLPLAGQVLPWLAAAGLVAWLTAPGGRLVLVILITSLVPYMLTWSLRGGDHWRFTMHAYPIYLVAAFTFVVALSRGASALFRDGARRTLARVPVRRTLVGCGLVVLITGLALLEHYWIPHLVARESLKAGDSVSIEAGSNDRVFFKDGWSDLVRGGNVVARLATSPRSTIWLPVPDRRPYQLVIRMDPVPFEDAPPQRVRAFLDGRVVGVFSLTWNPERVGSYAAEIPAEWVSPGWTRLDLMADYLKPLDKATAFSELPRSLAVGFRLWYVRLTPH
jgi:hypothetical protein